MGRWKDVDVRTRFWGKVDKRGPDECWHWKGSIHKGGYGHFWLTGQWHAHRAAYHLFVGPITEGMFVLHRCDNRICVNPAHLWLGTHLDNMQDMQQKGRANYRHYASRSHCKYGHEYTPENTKIIVRGRITKRHCRACKRRTESERGRRETEKRRANRAAA